MSCKNWLLGTWRRCDSGQAWRAMFLAPKSWSPMHAGGAAAHCLLGVRESAADSCPQSWAASSADLVDSWAPVIGFPRTLATSSSSSGYSLSREGAFGSPLSLSHSCLFPRHGLLARGISARDDFVKYLATRTKYMAACGPSLDEA